MSKRSGSWQKPVKNAAAAPCRPVIPLHVVDAPTQRLYVLACYGLLLAWRLYDWSKLIADEADSFWLFIKWAAIDGVFLYGLPALRIPWLEWSSPIITAVFILHAVLDAVLMFRIPIPVEAWLVGIVKILYDREISISENTVKPDTILRNKSLIMGKQIINVLPEGSAVLNPARLPFCINSGAPTVRLPIKINETEPVLMELLRLDFDTNEKDTILIKQKELRSMTKYAMKRATAAEGSALVLEYPVKKPGLYRLQRAVDKSNLEVQRQLSDTLVVICPQASFERTTVQRCSGDLSDLMIDVQGTPPLKIVYSRTINRQDQSFHFQSIQPEHLVSPLTSSSTSTTKLSALDEDVSWGRSRLISVRLNETMSKSGKWLYSIDEVHDAVGNIAKFSSRGEDGEHIYPSGSHLEQALEVYDRPHLMLEKCDTRHPLNVAHGKSTKLPLKFGPLGRTPDGSEHTITYLFSTTDTLSSGGSHGENVVLETFTAQTPSHSPDISRAGLYTLQSVRNRYCAGEIREPASCLLTNPSRPDLMISTENIFDKCAGNSVGLLVDLDLIGTAPFTIKYETIHNRNVKRSEMKLNSLRHQLELKPKDAGHYVYKFVAIHDAVYDDQTLDRRDLTLEQDVKPSAWASFYDVPSKIPACIEEPVSAKVRLSGDGPFGLEYEIVHDGKRMKHKLDNIVGSLVSISTPPLSSGGEYSLALTSIQDKAGCKIFLNDEIKIEVRRQRPRAFFSAPGGKRTIMTLENKMIRLPLRLEGEAPWSITYHNLNDTARRISQVVIQDSNSALEVFDGGEYELLTVKDRSCPGTIDDTRSTFIVNWIPRPVMSVAETAGMSQDGKLFNKREVCEGDLDALELSLTGSPPFHFTYRQRHKPSSGSPSVSTKDVDVPSGIATISLDTTKAGECTYEFSGVSDISYDYESGKFDALILTQRVNPRPSAAFAKPGQSYKYCKQEDTDDEVVPIILEGAPPFYIELDIKHQSTSRPETVKVANIETHRYDFRIPHRVLSLGTHQVSIRKVRDGRGCERNNDHAVPHVQVQVYDIPTIHPMEARVDYCVGDRIAYSLSGSPPFEVHYIFDGQERQARSSETTFRRIAERPGEFVITGLSDKASTCQAAVNIRKTIHELPSVRLSKGLQTSIDIHEGGRAELLLEFWGTPPFEFTYTRSSNVKKGQKPQVLETRHDISYEYSTSISCSQEGTYEVVAIKDKYCAFSTQLKEATAGRKLLQS